MGELVNILENDVLLTRRALADKLKVHTRTIDRWRSQGLIKDVHAGRKRILISENSVLSFLQRSGQQSSAVN